MVYVQIYARIISWVLLLGENYSCHFWLPIIFHFTFLFLFLYSVLKVRVVGSNGLEPSTSRLSGVRSNHLSYEPISVAVRLPSGQTCLLDVLSNVAGGDEQNRTVDPLLARQVLSQLSYTPKKIRLNLTRK